MQEVVIIDGIRTAIGSFGGSLKTVSVMDLGATVMKGLLKKASLRPVVSDLMADVAPDSLKDQGRIELEENTYDWDESATPIAIDEVIMGNVLQAGQGQNLDRVPGPVRNDAVCRPKINGKLVSHLDFSPPIYYPQ